MLSSQGDDGLGDVPPAASPCHVQVVSTADSATPPSIGDHSVRSNGISEGGRASEAGSGGACLSGFGGSPCGIGSSAMDAAMSDGKAGDGAAHSAHALPTVVPAALPPPRTASSPRGGGSRSGGGGGNAIETAASSGNEPLATGSANGFY